MDVEFDTAKDAVNLKRHGVSLAFGARVFDDPAYVIVPSIRQVDGEDRYKAVGMVDAKLWTAVHVYRRDVVRFISVRRSNKGEQGLYDRYPG